MYRIALASLLLAFTVNAHAQSAMPTGNAHPDSNACDSLATTMQGHWPDSSTRVLETRWVTSGTTHAVKRPPISFTLPAHCEVIATMQERIGVDGQHYAIRFHLRLPQAWNGRFLFQGGGGSNGELGDAIGMTDLGSPLALEQGFAVVSQDSGHDNAVNTVAERNGQLAFGFDPQARANYGHASLKPVAVAAKAAIDHYYGRNIEHSYFVGCSKGGQEGMMFAQRYPEVFDGIVAGAPGFSLPRAAVAELWDLQAFARVNAPQGDKSVDLKRLRESFSDAQFAVVRDAVLDVCDAADGVRDGITANFSACTTRRVVRELRKHRCKAGNSDACLSSAQIDALKAVYAGPKNSKGEALYSEWPWDGGIGSAGWRQWKIGSADGSVPSLNFVLGAKSWASVFSTPPTILADTPEAVGDFVARFNFDRDAAKIYAKAGPYQNSAWEDIGAKSADLSAFKAHGGKLIVPHGVSDPVFSINDTLAWYREVDALNHGAAAQFVRVFPIPGMAHCSTGPAVGQFATLKALVAWVENNELPDHLVAKGGIASPWPERTRPVCAYPTFAKYIGNGSIEDAANFVCQPPAKGQ